MKYYNLIQHSFAMDSADPLFNGMVVGFHLFSIFYFFAVSAILCDNYLIPIVTRLSKKLHLSNHASGAIFLALVSSLPELMTSILTVVSGSKQEMSLGMGALIGSGVVEFTLVLAVACLAVKGQQTINIKTMGKDLFFYVSSVVVMLWISFDQKITIYEALSLVLLWICYIFSVIAFEGSEEQPCKQEEAASIPPEDLESSIEKQVAESQILDQTTEKSLMMGMSPLVTLYNYLVEYPVKRAFSMIIPDPFPEKVIESVPTDDKNRKQSIEEEESLLPSSAESLATTADTANDEDISWFRLLSCFFMSVVVMSVLVASILTLCSHLTTFFGMESAKMGLIFMGMAGNVPDMINVYVAVQGDFLDLAFGMIPGAQILNLLIGLGMPWLIYCLTTPGHKVEIAAEEDVIGVEILLGVILVVGLTFALSRGKVTKICALPLFLAYSGFLAFIILD